jgi:phosphoglycolate phosphatase
MNKSYKAYIFDMDGTVLDTVADLKNAINYAFDQTGHKNDFTDEDAKRLFGSGVLVAFERGLALEAGASYDDLLLIGTDAASVASEETKTEIAKIQEIYSSYYPLHCNDETGPYDGILEVLEELKKQGLKTAVVSNKPDLAVQKLVDLYFKGKFDFALGDRPELQRKPAADMTNLCLEALGVSQQEAVYIGDSEIDMQTAENAGLDCISVDWGFRPKEFLVKQGAKRIISSPKEILD